MAKSTSLFPDPPFRFTVAADRTEPRVWVRRLVVVAERSTSGEVIREVEFRRGLNVVRVADRPDGDNRIIAHSVGKTLLTRLLRYCLGEQHFATEPRAAIISGRFPTVYVIAEVRVDGVGWVVARPLRDGRAADSFAVRADDWKAGLVPTGELGRFTEFTRAVEEQAFAGLPELRLPIADRAPRWLHNRPYTASPKAGVRVFRHRAGYGEYHRWELANLPDWVANAPTSHRRFEMCDRTLAALVADFAYQLDAVKKELA